MNDMAYIRAFLSVIIDNFDMRAKEFRFTPSASHYIDLRRAMNALQVIRSHEGEQWALANLKEAGVGKWVARLTAHFEEAPE